MAGAMEDLRNQIKATGVGTYPLLVTAHPIELLELCGLLCKLLE